MRRIACLLLAALILLPGCTTQQTDPAEQKTLWIVTEESASDSMNYQVEEAIKAFGQTYPDVTIQLEILPTEELTREQRIKQLRTRIMAGEGPDLYLLPAGNLLYLDSSERRYTETQAVEPLFQDVAQAMRSGLFYDIQEFYEADTALNTAALQQDVMAAGVVDGARYVLPLRYDLPVLLVNMEDTFAQEHTGTENLKSLAEYAQASADVLLCMGLQLPTDTSIFPNLYDYSTNRLLVDVQEIADYMRTYQQWYAVASPALSQLIEEREATLREDMNEQFHNYFPDILKELHAYLSYESFNEPGRYLSDDIHWTVENMPVYVTSLEGTLYNAILAGGMEIPVNVYPAARLDGSVGAEVTYYGAIGSNCSEVELAYQFLRLFLTEEYQWDGVRPRRKLAKNEFGHNQELQHYGLVEHSWPVRVQGSTNVLMETMRHQYQDAGTDYRDYIKRNRQFRKGLYDISTEDLPLLSESIDEVRFPVYMAEEETLAYALSMLNNQDGTPTDVDIDALAQQFWENLWWHLAEG